MRLALRPRPGPVGASEANEANEASEVSEASRSDPEQTDGPNRTGRRF